MLVSMTAVHLAFGRFSARNFLPGTRAHNAFTIASSSLFSPRVARLSCGINNRIGARRSAIISVVQDSAVGSPTVVYDSRTTCAFSETRNQRRNGEFSGLPDRSPRAIIKR